MEVSQMKRMLLGVAELFDESELMFVTAFVGAALAIVGLGYQAGQAPISWNGFNWFPLAGFALVAFAVASACTQSETSELDLEFFLPFAAIMALFAPASTRFPGLHINWLWGLLAVSGLVHAVVAINRHWTYRQRLPVRFARVLPFIGLTALAACVLIDRSYAVLGWAVAANFALVICRRALVRQKQHTGTPARSRA